MITPMPWCLTPSEAAIFGALYRWQIMTREAAAAAVASIRRHGQVASREIDRMLWRLRRKLGPYDITVANHPGDGWYLDARSRARARYLLERAFGPGATA